MKRRFLLSLFTILILLIGIPNEAAVRMIRFSGQTGFSALKQFRVGERVQTGPSGELGLSVGDAMRVDLGADSVLEVKSDHEVQLLYGEARIRVLNPTGARFLLPEGELIASGPSEWHIHAVATEKEFETASSAHEKLRPRFVRIACLEGAGKAKLEGFFENEFIAGDLANIVDRNTRFTPAHLGVNPLRARYPASR